MVLVHTVSSKAVSSCPAVESPAGKKLLLDAALLDLEEGLAAAAATATGNKELNRSAK